MCKKGCSRSGVRAINDYYDTTEITAVIDCWAKNQHSGNDRAATVALKCEIKRDVIVARRNSTAMMD